MIESIQKVIRIGSSGGVTIPAKEMKRQGIQYGDEVKVTVEPVKKSADTVADDYKKFVDEYGETLKNLAGR
jgi:antitoxin component of MazEF toxin-antitoxin module